MNKKGKKIVVVGTGYVGLVTGACFAKIGHDVLCVDKDQRKIDALNEGKIPIYEPGLAEIVSEAKDSGNINFSTELDLANIDAVFLAVGTPTDSDTGNADMSIFFSAAEEVKRHQKNGSKLTIISKSTVPVGTGKKLKEIFGESANIVSNPEFLREGSAVSDFMKPDRVIVGCDDEESAELLKDIYSPLNCEIFFTSIETSELIKYASNSFLATKVAFINEMADLCEANSADVSELAEGMGMDKRIGKEFLKAGPGIGGSCFPKDIRALKAQAKDSGVKSLIIDGVIESNENRKKSLANRIAKQLNKGAKIAIFGLAFKANTDDVRESAAVDIANHLLEKGFEISAYDPKADTARINKNIKICESAEVAAKNVEAIVILTEWEEFKQIDYNDLEVKNKVIFDLRNLLKSNPPKNYKYYSIGKNLPF